MAITASSLTSGSSTTAATSYATASVTPGANRLVLACIAGNLSGSWAAPSSVTGNGLTWVQVGSVTYDNSGTYYGVAVFRAMGGSPSAGAITFNFAASQGSACWSILEFDGVNTGGTNGSSAVVQAVQYPTTPPSSSTTSASATLATLASASNMAVGIFAWEANEQGTQGSGFTKLPSTNPSIAGPSMALLTEHRTNVTTVDASWTTSAQAGGWAIEVAVSAATNASATVASGTGTAHLATPSVPGSATAGVASGTGSAHNATVPAFTPKTGLWRWYTDATPDASMTALAAADTAPTLTAAQMQNGIVRLRVQVREEGGAAAELTNLRLQYGVDNTNWQDIQAQTPTLNFEGVWFRHANGAATAGNTIGTTVLSGTTVSGTYIESGTTDPILAASSVTEYDFAIYVHWPRPDTTVRFRVVYGTSTVVPVTSGGNQIQLITCTAADRPHTITALDPDGATQTAREMRFGAWNRLFWDSGSSRWWFFTCQYNTPRDLAYYSWTGSGAWSSLGSTTFSSDGHQGRHAVAYKSGKVYAMFGSSSTTRHLKRGVISGSSITWDAEQTVSQNSDRHRHICVDDGGYVWIGGITASTGVWVRRATSTDSVSAWQAAKTASDTGVASGDVFAMVGLASDKALCVWRSGSVLNSAVVTDAGGFGSVVQVNATSVADDEDWGMVRDPVNGYVYVVHTDSTSPGGNWVLRVYNVGSDSWSTGTSPGISGQTSDNDGLPVTLDGNDIYVAGTFPDSEGGQSRRVRYAKYSGPGASGTWGALTNLTPTVADRGNGDHLTTAPTSGNSQVIWGFEFNDDGPNDIAGTGFTAEYHYLSLSTATNASATAASAAGTTSGASTSIAPGSGSAGGTGASSGPRGMVLPTAGVGSATGSAFAPGPSVGASAGAASGAGPAFGATTKVSPTAGVASGTATANAPSSSVTFPASFGSASGSASGATVSLAPGAGGGSGSGSAGGGNGSIAVSALVASASGAANTPTVLTGTVASASVAAATGTAYNATAVGNRMHLATPTRAAFYYPWFPETWTVGGQPIKLTPTLGEYDLDAVDAADIYDQHIAWLDQAGIDLIILSWWGQTLHNEDARLPLLLSRIAAAGTGLKVCIYYEEEGFSDESAATIEANLDYLAANYAEDPAFLWRSNKPVIFVYNSGDSLATNCLSRWSTATSGFTTWYVVAKVFASYLSASPQPDSWHQYGPASREDTQGTYSKTISPGYWQANDPDPPGGEFPYLARDLPAFYAAYLHMIAATTTEWHLVTTFNEWGEGTAIEPSVEYGTAFLEILAGTLVPVNGQVAAGSGSANNASIRVAPGSGFTAASGSASGATAAIAPGSGVGSGSGSALGGSGSLAPTATPAVGSGSASDATISTAAAGSATAGVASGTGAGLDAVTGVSPVTGAASASVAASDATISTAAQTNVSAAVASATGSASGATAKVSPIVGVSAGSGTAIGPQGAVAPSSGSASATGAGSGPTVAIQTGSGVAAGTGSAVGPGGSDLVTAGSGSASGSASNATTSTANATQAQAAVAAASGVGRDIVGTLISTRLTAAATGTGSASNAAGAPAVIGSASVASGSGSGLGVTARVAPSSGSGSGSGTAQDPQAQTGGTVTAGLAIAAGSAHNAQSSALSNPFHPLKGGWSQLLAIYRDAREELNRPTVPATECPNDGFPLRVGRGGVLYCPFDGFSPSARPSHVLPARHRPPVRDYSDDDGYGWS